MLIEGKEYIVRILTGLTDLIRLLLLVKKIVDVVRLRSQPIGTGSRPQNRRERRTFAVPACWDRLSSTSRRERRTSEVPSCWDRLLSYTDGKIGNPGGRSIEVGI